MRLQKTGNNQMNNITPKTVGELAEISATVDKAFDVSRLPFRRTLAHEEIHKLNSACSLAFKAKIHHQIIERIMHYCYYVERQMRGRAAGNIEDLIIRYLMRYFASLLYTGNADQCHLEIGVLFGASTIFSYHATQLAKKDIPNVVIDPFEGYYGQDLDPTSKMKVNEETFLENLERFQVPKERIEILKGFSSNTDIINACKNKKVLSLLIDGDHTYNGVKNDWINYSPLVIKGGYVLIDDYNNAAWPEINHFVNKEVLSNLRGKWEVVLVFGNSILLKRTSLQEDKDTTDAQRLFNQLVEKEKQHDNLKSLIIAIEKGHETDISTLLSSFKGSKEPIEKLIEKIRNHEETHQSEIRKLSGEVTELCTFAEQTAKEKAEAQAQIDKILKEKAEAQAQIDKILKEKTEAQAQIDKILKEKTEAQARIDKISKEIAEAHGKIERLQKGKAEADKLLAEIKRLNLTIAKKEDQIKDLKNSLSWKLTAPLRWIKR
jgi:peptidoglycan hydrolase CwlO-like protein